MSIDLDGGLRTCVLLSAEVAELVADRIRPQQLQQGEPLPAVTYQDVDEDTFDLLNGGTDDYRSTTYDLDIYATTRGEARAIAEALYGHLHPSDFIVGPIGDQLEIGWTYHGGTTAKLVRVKGRAAMLYHQRQTYGLLWRPVPA